MVGNTHVPDKLEGYLLQVRHALFELISVDDRIVSIEAYDDVAVETDEQLVLNQTKSVLSRNNPAANRSEVFWKAIYNWCNYIKENTLPQKSIVLKYVVVASHKLTQGEIPDSFSKAKTTAEAKIAFENARKELFGDDTNKKEIASTIKPYIDFCFAPQNESLVLKVISLMETDIHDDSYDNTLIEKFKKQIIPQEYASELFYSMLGWVTDQVHSQTKQNKPAYISSSDYRKVLSAEVRSRDHKLIWSAVSVHPEKETTTAEIERHDTYIKQLELIDLDTSEIFEAASDFLRTRAEKTAWAEKGLINEWSFSDYYDGLKRIWKTQKLLTKTMNTDEVQRGQQIYTNCQSNAIGHRLLGGDVPSFFGSGSLQALANEPSAQPEIGWHPRYVDLLKGEEPHDE